MKTIRIAFIPLFLSLFLVANAQNKNLEKAESWFAAGVYAKAIPLYEQELKLKKRNINLKTLPYRRHLAKAYWETGSLTKAEKWYEALAKLEAPAAEDRINYLDVLLFRGKYEEAKIWAQTWQGTLGAGKDAERVMESADFGMAETENGDAYKISKTKVSGRGADSWSLAAGNDLYVLTTGKKVYKGTNPGGRLGSPFYNLYYATRIAGPKGFKMKKLKGKVNSGLNEGPAAFDPDGTYIYYTSGNHFAGKRKKPKKAGLGTSKIYRATKKGKKWVNPEPLSFNSDDYSCLHPAVSPDGKKLVFASDIEGGLGGFDLYLCEKTEKGWSTPTNLGARVNSHKDELFPSFDESGTLYFASNGRVGLGGFDLFSAAPARKKWATARNLGYPLNSSYDDFALSVIPGKGKGTFSSNRPKGQGLDDIYSFSRRMGIEGTVVDSRTKEPLKGVKVRIQDVNNRAGNYVTDENGRFVHYGDPGKEYFVTYSREEYKGGKKRISTAGVGAMDNFAMMLELEADIVLSVAGNVTDAESGKPVEAAEISLRAGEKMGSALTGNADGSYLIELTEDQDYELTIGKPGYLPAVYQFTTRNLPEPKVFEYDAKLKPGNYFLVQGKTVHQGTGKPMAGVEVKAYANEAAEPTLELTTSPGGSFWMFLDPTDNDYLKATREGYFPNTWVLPAFDASAGKDTVVQKDFEMVGAEPGALIQTIYYDYNQSSLKKDANVELLGLVSFLKENPGISVELASHTDARGGASYNQRLSQKRANAARKFLIESGVEASRVKAKGYGESQLLNKCKDGVDCSDEEHALNRRTEVRVSEMK